MLASYSRYWLKLNAMQLAPPKRTLFHVDVYVAPSAIHGKGLFAGARISERQHALTWGGRVFSGEEVKCGACEPHTAIRIGDDEWLGESIGETRDSSDFMNHSCMPNVALDSPFELRALTQIEKDEELTADYSTWLNDARYARIVSCQCGRAGCRHIISGVEWRNPDFARAKYQQLSPYVRGLVDKHGILR